MEPLGNPISPALVGHVAARLEPRRHHAGAQTVALRIDGVDTPRATFEPAVNQRLERER